MLKTFSIGGVHPHENKLSAHQPIVQAEIPAKAVILLGQHIGAPAKPIVAKGDVVKVCWGPTAPSAPGCRPTSA